MKKYINLILFACLAMSFCSCNAGDRKTIRGMYIMEDRITGPEEVSPENLEGYDFFYLVMTPVWKAGDFDAPGDGAAEGFMSGRTELVRSFISTAHACGAKVLLCLQGEDFVNIASNAVRRRNFTDVATGFIEGYGFDGIDLDWEQTVTKELHLDMMRELRRGLDGMGGRRYLTTALNCGHEYTADEAAALSEVADWINIMYYDMGGGFWGTSAGHNAPLNAIKENYDSLWRVFDASKLHIGLASYGYAYHDLKPGEKVPEGKTLADYMLPFWNAPADWTEEWDGEAQVPYYYSPDGKSFMTVENARSLEAKAEWIKEIGAGGFFWWEFHCDRDGTTGKHALSDAFADNFNR